MGVPGFFAWLLKNYKNNKIVIPNVHTSVDVLYLDTNCLIHPQCFKILNHFSDWENREKLEDDMMKRSINYIDYLINFVNPKDEVYISIDGVAPLAKMNQQRKRRFRSIDDNKIRDDIKKKHKIKISNSWSNTVITPGTIFMEKLNQKIIDYIKKNNSRKIRYSSYHTPGEGEHKILQDIKIKQLDKKECDKSYVIYGLDADLIFLALATQKNNIYLLREAQHFGKNSSGLGDILLKDFDIIEDVFEEFNYVSIDNMKECINKQIINIIEKRSSLDDVQETFKDHDFTNDFIFICYLLGNDFLPHLPSVDVKINGLNLLIDCFVDTFMILNTNLVVLKPDGEVDINNIFLEMYLSTLSKYEDYFFRNIYPKHREKMSKRRCPVSDDYEREIWDLENMVGVKVDDPIKLGSDRADLWKFRYYEHYFGVVEHQEDFIKKMADEYLRGIVWVTKYYFKECPSWDWQYEFSHAPFISDISKYFTQEKVSMDKFKFDNSGPINPCTQLLAVLPPTCYDLLPETYKNLVTSDDSDIIDFYPIKLELDMLNKDMFYKCIPLIPCVDIERIKKSIKNKKLTKDEIIRNSILSDFSN